MKSKKTVSLGKKSAILNQKTVSVILPFYNAKDSLPRAIQSILNQSYQNTELILVDNNSDEGSTEIAKAFADQHKNIHLFHESKQGVTFASNKATLLSNGEYIARMDSDDYSYPNRILQQVKFLDNNPDIGAVSGLVNYVAHRTNTEGFRRYVNWSNSIICYNDIFKKRFIESPIVNPSIMWRRSVGEEHGLYQDGDFPEDYELYLRWLSRGVKIEKIEEIILDWYDSDKRLTRSSKQYSNASFYQIKSEYLRGFLHENVLPTMNIAVWGASRLSRRWVQLLENKEITIDYYIDIKEDRRLNKKVIHYSKIPTPGKTFLLIYQAQSDIREKIAQFLKERMYIEGNDFLFVA